MLTYVNFATSAVVDPRCGGLIRILRVWGYESGNCRKFHFQIFAEIQKYIS